MAMLCITSVSVSVSGQLIDKNKALNTANEGISRPLIGGPYPSQVGDGRTSGDPNASLAVIATDPFRAIRRGRQLFQRKFSRIEGQGPLFGDGFGNIDIDLAIGAGLSDSCAGCHGRPRGAAGFGGDVVTRPDSRDSPHLFGLGLKEMLADEITADLRAIRDDANARALKTGRPVVNRLASKGISYGTIKALPNGTFDTDRVRGVDPDLRVRPFFAHGGTISIREFVVGALKDEMGLAMTDDLDLAAAQLGPVTTPSGMVLNGLTDAIDAPPAFEEGDIGNINQRAALVDFMEFYLLNYFKPGTGELKAGSGDDEKEGLTEVVLRHGGEAQQSRDAFAALRGKGRESVVTLLNSLILFPPDDTASNLDPGDRNAVGFPQRGHGSIKLTVLFNNPSIVE